ncbi:AAA family ATPase [bacterium]|nr:AAA family ATPase [bacterium]
MEAPGTSVIAAGRVLGKTEARDVAMTNEMPLAGLRLGVFGKGGSGKSTFVVLLAQVLQEQGYKVCVVDADSTNEGTSQALGVVPPPRPLIDYYGGMVFGGGAVTCPVDDPTKLPEANVSPATLPSEYWGVSPEGIRLLILGKMGNRGPGAGCDGPIAKIARDLRVSLDEWEQVTLLDFKAGFEDVARGVITGLDWVVVVVDPSTAAFNMAVSMERTVHALGDGAEPATAHLESEDLVEAARSIYREARVRGVFVVLNRVPAGRLEAYIEGKLRAEGLAPIGAIRGNNVIRDAWAFGKPLRSRKSCAEVAAIAAEIEVRAASGSHPGDAGDAVSRRSMSSSES